MGVLFDLDLTLVDSSSAEQHRKKRDWQRTYATIPQFTAYEGIKELLQLLLENDVPVCVVTTSPKPYCERVLKHFGFKLDNLICYHDTSRRKPHPDPIIAGVRLIQSQPDEAIAVGDMPHDVQAARSAGVFSVAALWGAVDRQALLNSNPDALAPTVEELKAILIERLPQLEHLRK